MKVDTPAIQRLRDHLLGLARESIGPQYGATRAREHTIEEQIVMNRFRPYAELFYLVATIDGQIDERERAVMMGAFRSLTGGRVRGAVLRRLEIELDEALAEQGLEARLEFVCSAFANDREEAELAFALAAAVALADERVEPSEEKFLLKLASWLRISEHRAFLITHLL